MYGITAEEYATLHAVQGGVCAICRQECRRNGDQLSVDHDHETGAVRGLLCKSCNQGIAHFEDDVRRLYAAIAYLQDAAQSVLGQGTPR